MTKKEENKKSARIAVPTIDVNRQLYNIILYEWKSIYFGYFVLYTLDRKNDNFNSFIICIFLNN